MLLEKEIHIDDLKDNKINYVEQVNNKFYIITPTSVKVYNDNFDNFYSIENIDTTVYPLISNTDIYIFMDGKITIHSLVPPKVTVKEIDLQQNICEYCHNDLWIFLVLDSNTICRFNKIVFSHNIINFSFTGELIKDIEVYQDEIYFITKTEDRNLLYFYNYMNNDYDCITKVSVDFCIISPKINLCKLYVAHDNLIFKFFQNGHPYLMEIEGYQ